MAKPLIQDIISKKKVFQTSSKQFPPTIDAKKDREEKKLFFIKDQEELNRRKEKPDKKLTIKFPRLKLPRFHLLHFEPRHYNLKLKLILGFIILGVAVIGGIFLLNKFSSISVEITPRQEFVDIDATFTASVDSQKNKLPLEVMQISRKEKGTAQPSGVKQVSRKASGKIVIYNTYSSQTQFLISGTRFEATNGKIFRIDKSVVLPGAKIDGGKITPSELEVTVFADKPGEEYNIDLTDFTVPGFQDPAKREKIYARSKTKMENGFVGEASFATEDDINKLRSSLKEKVTNYLLKMGANPKAENFLLYDDAKKIIFDEQKNGPKPGDETDRIELEESATLFGFLLKKSDLFRVLSEKYLTADATSSIEIVNADKLNFELKNYTATSITFSLKGQAHFLWKIDETSLKNDLIKDSKNPNGVFQNYPNIEKAKIVFKPSWWHYIPKNPSQIDIVRILKGTLLTF